MQPRPRKAGRKARRRMRVHELAKELGLSSKDLIVKLQALGIDARSHMTNLDDTDLTKIRRLAPGDVPPPSPIAPVAAPGESTTETVPVAEPEPVESPLSGDAKTPATAKSPQTGTLKVVGKSIRVKGVIVVKQLADALGVKPHKLIAEMMSMNVLASINQRLELPLARQVAEKHGYSLDIERKSEEPKPAPKPKPKPVVVEDRPEDVQSRPAVVTFLGHVDHGKTSLLDKIRNATVAKNEHGGITQHIGAYTVEAGGKHITFLDTPGHAAFTAMRARGANLTDIAVIIIAADDGIMPQTREAISHAQAAKVAIMIAINKIDLPAANLDRVKQQLQGIGLTPEDWGGEIICCPVSATTGKGVDHLLEMILLQAEILELKANPRRRAHGFVVEAQMEPGMGPTATLLIKDGTLSVGDVILCDRFCNRIRGLINDHGIRVKSAGPSMPVKCIGLPGVPEAGAEFMVHENEKAARVIAMEREQQTKAAQVTMPVKKTSLEDLFGKIKDGELLELKVILKADTQGSLEAIENALQDIKSDKVRLNLLMSSTGNVTTNDIMLASASDAVILGFHVGREPGVDSQSRHQGVDIRLYHIIYEMLDQVRAAMLGLLAPLVRDKLMGHAKVLQVFPLGKRGKVAGCMVTDGTVTPKFRVRVRRNNETLCEGSIDSLRRFQDQSAEVREGQECGLRLDKNMDFDVGDILEFYLHEEIQQTL
ncbi:MAG: translation initiation factor IF-2 [Lentisphaerae bacterium RIFOXYB12_FULL_60_10]|nr:MAG: translation initiation factor IF-2 [Lentisphaerae bacterium RIFOXYB12_FULL_60_10]